MSEAAPAAGGGGARRASFVMVWVRVYVMAYLLAVAVGIGVIVLIGVGGQVGGVQGYLVMLALLIPLGFAAALVISLPAAVVWWGLGRALGLKLPGRDADEPRCGRCGADLGGVVSDTCPACGLGVGAGASAGVHSSMNGHAG
ncbi:MAG: hypothetical protein SFZ24_01685 [Planctomycetota bacterium]|nr:hypothetical protein [Planctomycetota bacterium]